MIPEQYQPDSLKDLARIARMSRAGVCRALNHLESHGWVKRDRRSPGRGHSTGYVLSAGADCDCGPGPSLSEPVPDAVRMRRYRNRKKASQGGVTDREKASQGESLPGDKASQSDVTKRLASRNDAAGQTPVSAKSVSDEGGEEEGWPAGTIGATVNPWPPARIPGVRGEPVPADEPTRKVLRTLVDVLGPVEIMGAE